MQISELLASQGNLKSLCRSRPLHTAESFPPSDFYGNASVLKRWAELPPSHDTGMIVQHGVHLGARLWRDEIVSDIPQVYAFQDTVRARWAEIDPDREVIPGAAPFLYAWRMAEKPEKRTGTIFFPAHSTEHVQAAQDWEALAIKLEELPPAYHPVSVCLYWTNISKASIFAERGMQVFSCGHMFDNRFLERLATLLAMHRFAGSNDVGSHIFYSLAAGCAYFSLEHSYEYRSQSPFLLKEAQDSKPRGIFVELQNTYAEPLNGREPDMRSAAQAMLGMDELLPPGELREVLA